MPLDWPVREDAFAHGQGARGKTCSPHSQLICRVRPCEQPSQVIAVSEERARIEIVPEKGHPGEPLCFDHVLGPQQGSDQEVLFELIKPAVIACMQGTSCTVVTYGGPQSGKSFSISGFYQHAQLHGLAPRAIQFCVDYMSSSSLPVSAIESSFFEIQQDLVYDIVPRDCPPVSLEELNHAPYVALDSRLSKQKCDASDGCNRLLDTFFTGLEHRRKCAHICFQLSFIHNDGIQQSHLRFVEVAWPRAQASPHSNSNSNNGNGGGSLAAAKTNSLISLTRGKECAALEQVLQSKLSGSSPVPYSSCPLATLLKPCFEGVSSLQFVYCLRLEQSQLSSLAISTPLLVKLHLWLRGARGNVPKLGNYFQSGWTGVLPEKPAERPVERPVVPPLCLEAAQFGEEPLPASMLQATDVGSSPWQSSRSSNSCVAPLQGQGMPLGHEVGAESNFQPRAGASVLPPQLPQPPAVPQLPEPADLAPVQQALNELVAVKEQVRQTLRIDAHCSSVLLEECRNVINKNNVQSDVRDVFDRVSNSLHRTVTHLQDLEADLQYLSHFCHNAADAHPAYGNSAAMDPVIYPGYQQKRLTESNKGLQASPEGWLEPNVDATHVHNVSLNSSLSAGDLRNNIGQQGIEVAGNRGSIVIPMLQMTMVPKEHPEMPVTDIGKDVMSASSRSVSSIASDVLPDREEVEPSQPGVSKAGARVPRLQLSSSTSYLPPHAAAEAPAKTGAHPTVVAAAPQLEGQRHRPTAIVAGKSSYCQACLQLGELSTKLNDRQGPSVKERVRELEDRPEGTTVAIGTGGSSIQAAAANVGGSVKVRARTQASPWPAGSRATLTGAVTGSPQQPHARGISPSMARRPEAVGPVRTRASSPQPMGFGGSVASRPVASQGTPAPALRPVWSTSTTSVGRRAASPGISDARRPARTTGCSSPPVPMPMVSSTVVTGFDNASQALRREHASPLPRSVLPRHPSPDPRSVLAAVPLQFAWSNSGSAGSVNAPSGSQPAAAASNAHVVH